MISGKGMLKEEELQSIWKSSISGFYDETYFAPITPLINKFLIKNNCFTGALLDMGCGFGAKSHAFQKIGFCVTGIDGDKERIEKATKDFPEIDFRHFKIDSTLPFEDNSFDFVFSHSMFQYLEHDAILNEIRRILKPGGRIMMIENLRNNPITRLGRAYHKRTGFNFHSFPYNHMTYLEMERLKTTFKDASVHHFYLLSPALHLKPFRGLFPLLQMLDRMLLKINFLKRISWLALFTGNKNS
jgi:SAM-dependent methyltransferase